MKDSFYRFSLDIHSTQSQVSIPVMQGDTARGFLATLTEGGKPYHLSDYCRAAFVGTKADGNQLFNDCIILNNSIIRYDFTEQTTTSVGMVDAYIKVYGANNKLLTSPRLTLVVYEDPVGNIAPSATELNIIERIALNDADQDEAIAEINEELDRLGDAVFAPPPTSIDLSAMDTDGKIVETFADGSSKTTTMEYDVKGNPIKVTDGDGNVTSLTW